MIFSNRDKGTHGVSKMIDENPILKKMSLLSTDIVSLYHLNILDKDLSSPFLILKKKMKNLALYLANQNVPINYSSSQVTADIK